jgi:hypothetical protein
MYPWSNKGAKLTDYDIPRLGHKIGVGEDEIHAVLDVETRGSGFDDNGVIRLFEEHIFYRQLPKSKRDEAVRKGLAHPKWRRNYKDNYNRLLKAYDFDPTAALESCSWGLGQIMGFNCKLSGYNTALDMVNHFAVSESNQLEAMIEFIVTANLDDELRRHDWANFARGYNGAGYKANKYDTRLLNRYLWWSKRPDTPWTPDMAKQEHEEVEEIIANEPEVVYTGDTSPAKCMVSTAEVKQYQASKGLSVDGIIGPKTWGSLIK